MSAARVQAEDVAREALAALDDAARLALAEAALRTITDLRLAGQLAGAAHRITDHAHRLCDQAFREGRS